MENTLVLGNGLIYSLYKNATSWGGLLEGKEELNISNYTLLYEARRIEKKESDDSVKGTIYKTLSGQISKENIKKGIRGISSFGEYLRKNNINNIITTNMDKGIETLLCEKNGYKTVEGGPKGGSSETIYSIRRKLMFEKDGHTVSVWKIHGDIDSLKSMSFGYDQYCGQLSKIEAYVKGEYSAANIKCAGRMKEKVENGEYDGISWLELFFNTNVYIAGLGLDFSEIDLWWVLNKRYRVYERCREKKCHVEENRVVYLYSSHDLRKKYYAKFKEKQSVFRFFGVECEEMKTGRDFIESLFEHIKK